MRIKKLRGKAHYIWMKYKKMHIKIGDEQGWVTPSWERPNLSIDLGVPKPSISWPESSLWIGAEVGVKWVSFFHFHPSSITGEVMHSLEMLLTGGHPSMSSQLQIQEGLQGFLTVNNGEERLCISTKGIIYFLKFSMYWTPNITVATQ